MFSFRNREREREWCGFFLHVITQLELVRQRERDRSHKHMSIANRRLNACELSNQLHASIEQFWNGPNWKDCVGSGLQLQVVCENVHVEQGYLLPKDGTFTPQCGVEPDHDSWFWRKQTKRYLYEVAGR